MYRWVLRQYLGYLVEKRFTLEWYIEGTRSRTGNSARRSWDSCATSSTPAAKAN